MTKTKRFLTFALAIIMLLSLAACGKKQTEPEPVKETPEVTEAPEEDVDAVVEVFTLDNPEFVIDEGQEYDISKGFQGESESYELAISDFSVDGTNGCQFTLTVKNKLDHAINFTLYQLTVNGWPTECFCDMKLQAESSDSTSLTVPVDFLKRCRISAVNELKVYSRSYEKIEDLGDEFSIDEFSLYPTGMDAATARALREMDARYGQKVINRKDMELKILHSGFDSDGFYAITFLWSNKSDNWLAMTMDGFAINGYDAQNVNCDSEIPPQSDSYVVVYINQDTMRERFAGTEDLLKALRFDYAVYNTSSDDVTLTANGTCIVDLDQEEGAAA